MPSLSLFVCIFYSLTQVLKQIKVDIFVTSFILSTKEKKNYTTDI